MNMCGGHETAEETVGLSHNDNSKKTVFIKKTNFTDNFGLVYEALLCDFLEKFPVNTHNLFKSLGSYFCQTKGKSLLLYIIRRTYSFNKSYGFAQMHINLQ